MGGGNGKLKALVSITAAERLARARLRLEELRGQLGGVTARTDAHHGALADLQRLLERARAQVREAEAERDAAETVMLDARAAAMLEPEDAALAQHVATAEARLAECVAELKRAEESVAATEAKVTAEGQALEQLLAADERTRSDLAKIAGSLVKAEEAAHAAAGLERLAQLRDERQALTARRAELAEMLRAADADLEASQAAAAELAAEHPAIAGSLEVRELVRTSTADFHAVIAGACAFAELLEPCAGSPSVSGYWHTIERDGVSQNVPVLLKAGFDSEVLLELFGPLAGHALPRLQAMRHGLLTFALKTKEALRWRHACEDDPARLAREAATPRSRVATFPTGRALNTTTSSTGRAAPWNGGNLSLHPLLVASPPRVCASRMPRRLTSA